MTMDARRAILLASLVGLALRAVVGLALPIVPSWDGVVYERAATQLARGEAYDLRVLNPAAPAHRSAFYPIGWPAALAIWRMAGAPRALDPLLQAILGALAVPLAALVARRLRDRSAAVCAAWTVALWPGGIFASASWMSEPLFGLLLLLGLAPLVARHSTGALVAAALGLALATFVRPTALAIAPLAIGAAAWLASRRGVIDRDAHSHTPTQRTEPIGARPDRRKRTDPDDERTTARALAEQTAHEARSSSHVLSRATRSAAAAALALAIAFAVLSPWMLRNAGAIGGAVVSANSGANLLAGTVSARFAHVPREVDCPRGMRELARDRCRRDRALARIASAPLSWIALAPLKLAHTFAYETSSAVQLGASLGIERPTEHPAVWALAALATAYWLALLTCALLSLRRTRLRARAVVLTPFVALALVHVAFIGGDRYHTPLVPLTAALAAPTIARAVGRVRRAMMRR